MAPRKPTKKKAPPKKPAKRRTAKTVVCAEEDRWGPLKNFGWLLAGGLGAAGAGALLVRNGVSTTTTGLMLAAGGLGAAVGTNGPLQMVGGGAAAAASGQLALAWMAKRVTEKDKKVAIKGKDKKGRGIEPGYSHVEELFAQARQDVAEQYDEIELEAA